MPEKLTVLIMAGGHSRRLGQDKVWLSLDGQPLVERVVRRVLPLASEILFSTGAPERLAPLAAALPVPARCVADLQPGAGPMAGLQAGLSAARNDLVLALATDMPFVDPALLRHLAGLAAGYDAVVPQVPRPQDGSSLKEPLHAVYRRSCLPAIDALLANGDRSLLSLLPRVNTRDVSPVEIRKLDPDFLSFFNINTPEDWQKAQTLAALAGR